MSRVELNVQKIYQECLQVNIARQSANESQATSQELVRLREGQLESKEILQSLAQAIAKMENEADHRLEQLQEESLQSREKSSKLADDSALGPEKDPLVTPMPLMVEIAHSSSSIRVCPVSCSCHCHIRSRVTPPSILQQITGRLFLGYAGNPILQRPCQQFCLQRDKTSFNLTYFFPRWFLQQAISLSVAQSQFGTPSLNLKIRRVVPEVSKLFSMSKYGDVQGLRDLFTKGHASPDDVHISGGWSPLHVWLISFEYYFLHGFSLLTVN